MRKNSVPIINIHDENFIFLKMEKEIEKFIENINQTCEEIDNLANSARYAKAEKEIKSLLEKIKLYDIGTSPKVEEALKKHKENFDTIHLYMNQARRVMKEIHSEEGWILEGENENSKTFFKFGPDFSFLPSSEENSWKSPSNELVVGCKLSGVIECSLVMLLSVFYEIDLYSNWIFSLMGSSVLTQVGKFGFVSEFRWKIPIPFMSNRDVLCLGIGMDMMEDNSKDGNCVFVLIRSVEDHEYKKYNEKMEKEGSKRRIPENGHDGFVRMALPYMGFLAIPIDKNHTRLTLIFSAIPKMPQLPEFLLRLAAKVATPYIFSSISKFASKSENDKNSEYLKRIENNPNVYSEIQKRVSDFYEKEAKKLDKEKNI